MYDVYEKYQLPDNRILEICYDEDPIDPRINENLGTMVCFHGKYSLGDNIDLNSSLFSSWNELEEYLIDEEQAIAVIPLYLYDHSSITISTHPFASRWDSGQFGFIYTTQERVDTYGVQPDNVQECLEAEVNTYDQFVRGDVYGLKILEFEKCSHCNHVSMNIIDSCWGFYGDQFAQNGLFEYAGVSPDSMKAVA